MLSSIILRGIMTKSDEAVVLFKGNFNCAQSVFSTFAPEFGLDLETALKIATPLGGGLSHMREVCGAVAGGLMVIGLKCGMSQNDDLQAKDRSYALSQEFASRFTARNDSINCRKLIGYDLGNPKEYETAKREEVFEKVCTKFVRDAVEILQDILKECWTIIQSTAR
jgi:C_GCAxxG_C_C family probable redox protein